MLRLNRLKTAVSAGVKIWRGPPPHELAGIRGGRDITRGYVDDQNYLLPQDKVLIYQGAGNYELYEDILRDDRVYSTLAQRLAAVISRDWEVIPGGNRRRDRIAADFIKEVLTHLRWDSLTEKMLFAVFYGFSVAEVLWGRDGGQVIPAQIRVRNRRRFVFDADFQPRLLTSDNPNGELLPHQKFWIFSSGADNDDEPYGRGLAHWLYWPVWFKKNHIRFWLTFSEKFGAPTPMGKYQKHVTQAEREKLLQAVQAIHTESAIVIPDGMEIQLIEAARSGTVDYKSFYEKMNQAITTVVLSETMTTDDGSSQSQATVHMDVREEIVAADANLVDDSFNRQVVTWLTNWNYPGAAIPQVRRIMDDQPDLKAQAERDKLIVDMGYRPSQKYLEETYNIELEKIAVPAAGDPPSAPNTADFAEGDPVPLEDLDEVLNAIDEKEWEKLAAPLILPILNRAKNDPDSIINDLAVLYPALNAKALEERLARLLFVADAWGRLSEKKKPDPLTPPPPAPAGDPDGQRVPGRDRDPIPPSQPAIDAPDGERVPIPPAQPADAPDGQRAPRRDRDPIPPSQPAIDAPGGRGPVPPSPGGVRPPGRGAPPGPVNLGYAVRLPPRRAIEYFQQKGFAITWNWWDAWQDAHAKAFTVAKATRLDILETIRNALDKALAQGQTEAQFIKELQPLLEKAGWWGKQIVVSPDGGAQIVQLGSPRRLQTIFRTNMRTSYAAGRYRQQMENVDSRPYWMYDAVIDDRTRDEHAALDNEVFRHDDPFWDSHYPPNGFNCRCMVKALTKEDLKELNLQVSDSAGKLRQVTQEVGVDKATGEVIHRPGTRYDFIDDAGNPRSMTPDPGWSYNPGKAETLRDLNDKLNRASPALARETIKDTVNSPTFEAAFRSGDVRRWPLAVLPDDVAQALSKHGAKPPRHLVVDGIKPRKLQRKHDRVSVEQYQTLQRALDKGGVYLQPPGKGGRKTPSLLAEYQDGKGKWWLYAIDLKDMRTRTIFDFGPQHRDIKFKQEDIKIIREWDPRQWKK